MASVLDIIKHYQKDIERHSDDEAKVLRCIDKLFQLKVTVQHLQDTGVGRTVNALRKEPGEVGQAARALVLKWKTMVAAEESDQEEDLRNDTTQNGHGSGRDSDDHSRNSHDRHSSSKNPTPRPHHQDQIKEINGHHSSSKRKYHSSEEDHHEAKNKLRHTSSSENDHKKPVVVKQEKLSDSESGDDDSESSDSDSDSTSDSSREEVKVKTEIKQEIKKEIKQEKESPERHRSSSHSSKHSHSNHDERKKDTSSSKRYESSEKDRHSHHKSPKDASRHTSESSKSSSHKHKSSQEKESSSEKRHKSDTSSDEKKESKSSKHSSDKHKSSSHKHSSSDKHRNPEKHSSKEHKSSSHTDKAPEKHKSSSDKDSKHKSKESSSSSKEKHSSSKEKTKEQSSSSKERSNHSSEKKHTQHTPSESKSQSDKSKHKNDERSNEKKSKEKSSSSSSHKSKSSSSSKSTEEVPKKKSKISNGEESGEDGIDCGSGASFAEALGMIVSPSKLKKKSFKDVNSPNNTFSNDQCPASLLAPSVKLAPLPHIEISALPEISPNYKPRPPPKALPFFSEEDAISAGISSKNQRTKVYSGNKVIGKITSLYDMCVQVLQVHIDALEYTGGVPYDILKPVIDRATAEQLFTLEHYNPYLMEDTDHLWQKFCQKSFRNKSRQELETWREMYIRCQEEQECKLKSLTANIRLTQEAKKAPIKQTKMAYVDSMVKPPRNIARKQALHGTAFAASASPASRVASLSATPGVLKGSRPPPPAAPVSASSFNKPKKAPLMQKALQFMRGRKR